MKILGPEVSEVSSSMVASRLNWVIILLHGTRAKSFWGRMTFLSHYNAKNCQDYSHKFLFLAQSIEKRGFDSLIFIVLSMIFTSSTIHNILSPLFFVHSWSVDTLFGIKLLHSTWCILKYMYIQVISLYTSIFKKLQKCISCIIVHAAHVYLYIHIIC